MNRDFIKASERGREAVDARHDMRSNEMQLLFEMANKDGLTGLYRALATAFYAGVDAGTKTR